MHEILKKFPKKRKLNMPNNSFDEVMQYSPCEFCMHSAAFVVDYLFKDGCKIKGHDIYLGKVLLGFHHIFKSNTLHVSLGRLWLLWKQQNYGVWLPNQRFGGHKKLSISSWGNATKQNSVSSSCSAPKAFSYLCRWLNGWPETAMLWGSLS